MPAVEGSTNAIRSSHRQRAKEKGEKGGRERNSKRVISQQNYLSVPSTEIVVEGITTSCDGGKGVRWGMRAKALE